MGNEDLFNEDDSKKADETTGVVVPFDYSNMPENQAKLCRETAFKFKTYVKDSFKQMILAGQTLCRLKEKIEHGKFKSFIESELGISHSKALNLMHITEKFSKNAIIADLDSVYMNLGPTVLYRLAAPGTSDEVVKTVIGEAKKGKKIKVEYVKQMLGNSNAQDCDRGIDNSVNLIESELDVSCRQEGDATEDRSQIVNDIDVELPDRESPDGNDQSIYEKSQNKPIKLLQQGTHLKRLKIINIQLSNIKSWLSEHADDPRLKGGCGYLKEEFDRINSHYIDISRIFQSKGVK